MAVVTQPFWRTKSLDEMTHDEWESLCDGCARCCMVQLSDQHGRRAQPTSAACKLLDVESCRCTDYAKRAQLVPGCTVMTPDKAAKLDWLPPTCAYRLVAHGEDLPQWHPLRTGDPDSVHRAGISMRGRAISELYVHPDDLVQLRIRW